MKGGHSADGACVCPVCGAIALGKSADEGREVLVKSTMWDRLVTIFEMGDAEDLGAATAESKTFGRMPRLTM